jgi:cell division inhibitor SepF
MIDFLSGVVFALSGSIQSIGKHVILCYPKEIVVAGSINFARDNEEDGEEE